MLMQTEAWAFLSRYTEPLRGAEWARVGFERHCNWVDPVREHVDVVVEPASVTKTTERSARLIGARLRLALGVAHAVSCCRGFEPATHQLFWRRVIVALWQNDDEDESLLPDEPALSPSRLQTFRSGRTTHDSQVSALRTRSGLVLHGTPACVALLSAVVNKLKPHLVGAALPPLRVALSRCYARDDTRQREDKALPYEVLRSSVVKPAALRVILCAALDAPADAWTCATNVGLVIDYRIEDDLTTIRAILALLACARTESPRHLQLTIDRLAIQLAPHSRPRSAGSDLETARALVGRGRDLGLLLRMLINDGAPSVHTVALFGCSHCDYRHVGAALSAAALSSPSVSALQCSYLFYTTQPSDKLLRLAWLAYALFARRRRVAMPLSLSLLSTGLALEECESDYIMELVDSGTPLRDVVGDALRLRFGNDLDMLDRLSVEYLPLGSTVPLARGTRLYFEPMRYTDECVAVALPEGEEEIDLIVRILSDGGSMGVVYGGYGLVWTLAASVIAWHAVECDSTSHGHGVALSSLTLGFEGAQRGSLTPQTKAIAHRITGMLSLVSCSTLETLKLDRAVVTREDLTQLLQSFPHLRVLYLDRCVVETVDPLLHAWQQPCIGRITSLSLLGTSDLRMRHRLVRDQLFLDDELIAGAENRTAPLWITPLVDALASGVARGVLQELYLDLQTMPSETIERAAIQHLILRQRRCHSRDCMSRADASCSTCALRGWGLCVTQCWPTSRVCGSPS